MPATKLAYVQASWHSEITDNCKKAFLQRIGAGGFDESNVDCFVVPGSLELPLLAKRLATSGNYRAVCASGLVVDGGIYRHEFVAQAVIDGLVQVSLETDVPVLSAVLTPQRFHEHEAHARFFTEHMLTKGKELAEACLVMIEEPTPVTA